MHCFRRCAAFLATIVFAATSSVRADAAAFSVDVIQFNYSYTGASFTPNFTIAGGFAPNTQDPVSGWYLSWNALESPVTSGAVGDVWRMAMPQAVLGQPDPPRALSSINGYGPFGSNNAPLDWQVTARLANIANATAENTRYRVRVGSGTFETGGVGLRIGVDWFTGNLNGTHYDNLMRIGSSLEVGDYAWESGDTGIILTDANPADTVLDLRVEVSNLGRTFSSYYQVDGDGGWNLAFSHTLPGEVGPLSGFALSHPYVGIYNDAAAPIPEVPSAYLLGIGLGVLVLTRKL
jgi:hypothetical protein